ncbi:type 4a pilus biogenesis protein PilO [Myxococcota bacterium]|nr:type 4a pilus biogenesis protein PilO [Myxococcota bacterium]MBU1429339.1 type 4a pilus biogenesis protein PilO [Myxococcota bacterium]MBU1898946.1 type 4a pilus biogenesis protein PilO [Myxococcota bacterium]
MDSSFDKFLALPAGSKLAIVLVFAALVGAGWYFTFYEEIYNNIVAERAKTPSLTQELSNEKALLKNLEAFKLEIDRLRRERDEMRSRLPEKAEIADLLKKIEGKAKTIAGLRIMRFERQPEEMAELYARIPVKMVLEGSFNELVTFFFYVGTLKRIVNVEDISFTATKREDGKTHLTALCNLTTFQYVAPKQAPAGRGGKKKKAKGGGH